MQRSALSLLFAAVSGLYVNQLITLCDKRFRIGPLVGEGGYGRVHVASIMKDSIRKKYAIKEMTREDAEPEIEILEDVATKGHPSINRYICSETKGESSYIVTDYYPGGTLANYAGRLSERQIWRILFQLASGLKFLHSKHIVHRDLKPDNILLTSFDIDEAEIKIADFGLAKYLPQDKKTDSGVGTALYMAPEVISETPYDASIDLWTMGILLYELVYDQTPFGFVGLTSLDQVGRYITQDYGNQDEFPHVLSKVSPELARVIAGLLNRNSEKRMSVNELYSTALCRGSSACLKSNGPLKKRLKRFEKL